MTSEKAFNKVGYTAVWTAYLRSFSDIPFAKKLYHELSQIEYGKESVGLQRPTMAPQYEARYKILTKLLLDSKINQVIELAAGFTGRGLALASELPITYVELEVPAVVAEKQKILKRLRVRDTIERLKLVAGNVLSMNDLNRAVAHFDSSKPIAVLNEGLMRYLTFPEKAMLATNIHELLGRHGGVWITPDISLASLLNKEDKAVAGHTERLTKITGKDVRGNLFDSVEHAQSFSEKLGFSVERHSLLEAVDELVSPQHLGISADNVIDMLAPATVFVMRVL